MSNNKQSSSIDWLINEHFGGIENCTPDFKHKIQQAKAMHKEEITEAYWNGSDSIEDKTSILKIGEQYYNETYK